MPSYEGFEIKRPLYLGEISPKKEEEQDEKGTATDATQLPFAGRRKRSGVGCGQHRAGQHRRPGAASHPDKWKRKAHSHRLAAAAEKWSVAYG